MAGDGLDVGAGLGRQGGLRGDEALGAGLAAVVGDGGEADVAEVAGEVGEVAGGGDEGLGRVEGVGEAAQLGGAGHELGDALGAGRADGGGVEEALLPDQAGEEARVEAVAARRRLDHAADVGDVAGEADAGGPSAAQRRSAGASRGGGGSSAATSSAPSVSARAERREAEKPREEDR